MAAMAIESPDKISIANRRTTFIHDHLMFMLQKKLCETSFYTVRPITFIHNEQVLLL